ncbi:MAG: helix-turn-helix domain-containing protein [Solirubrobacteraceae bacterium]
MSPPPAPRHALQQRVATAILDGAAQLFVVRGEQASMNEVAEAAGVARATVYRYFPNREALLDELAATAVGEVDSRLAAARIDEMESSEGVSRAVRALVEVGDLFVLLTRERLRSDPEQYERKLVLPLRRLLERAQADGEIRPDISSTRLTESLIGLVVGSLTSTAPLGKEDMTATVTGLFLDGARARTRRPR